MKRPLLLLPLLALLVSGCLTADVRVFDNAGAPVKGALILRHEIWTSGCCLWPTVWDTHVAMLTDDDGVARLSARNHDKLSVGNLVILSPDLSRYCLLRFETDDLPPVEEFPAVDFAADARSIGWMRDLDKKRIVFRGKAQERSDFIYAQWHRLRFPTNAIQFSRFSATPSSAEETHAESAEGAEPKPHAESAEGAE